MRRTTPFIIVCLLLFVLTSARAEWSTDPMVNNVVRSIPASLLNRIQCLPDGQGGVFVFWNDLREGEPRLYGQRLDADGNRLWDTSGVRVCTYDSWQGAFSVATDMAGGVIIAWMENSSTTSDIYAQRMDSGGNRIWIDTGKPVATSTHHSYKPLIDSDGQGGAVVGWEEIVDPQSEIYAQRLSPEGSRMWTATGVPVCPGSHQNTLLDVLQDGGGGVTLIWEDNEVAQALRMRRVNYLGNPIWDTNGIVVDDYSLDYRDASLLPDGSFGYIVAYLAESGQGWAPKVKRFNAAGTDLWDGLSVRAGVYAPSARYLESGSDDQGNLYLAWYEASTDVGDIRAQKVAANGTLWWGAEGRLINAAEGLQTNPGLVLDGQGGLLLTWSDDRHEGGLGNLSIYGQHLDPWGQELWSDLGEVINLGSFHYSPVCCGDGRGGLLAVWEDTRNNDSLYAQRVDGTGHLGDPAPDLTTVSDLPNDQGGQVELNWTASYLDTAPWHVVNTYSVWMRQPEGLAAAVSPLSGTELERLGDTLGCSRERLEALSRDGWTYVQEVPAMFQPAYGCLAPTYGDSTGSVTILSEYLVVGHGAETWLYWESQPLSGYSVDNLAPGAPLALAGAWNGPGEVLLQWQASGHHDEDLASYNVYRSAESGFAPEPSLLVGTAAATEFLDPAGAGTWYYRVTAVDVHGNEGEAGDEAAVSSTSPAPEALPRRCALRGNYPNPFNPATTIAFDLPDGRPVNLAVFSVKGELVATLAARDFPPGRHTVRWNGRDQDGREAPAGLYFARLVAGDFRQTRGMVLVK